jgi:hypothetical protein
VATPEAGGDPVNAEGIAAVTDEWRKSLPLKSSRVTK